MAAYDKWGGITTLVRSRAKRKVPQVRALAREPQEIWQATPFDCAALLPEQGSDMYIAEFYQVSKLVEAVVGDPSSDCMADYDLELALAIEPAVMAALSWTTGQVASRRGLIKVCKPFWPCCPTSHRPQALTHAGNLQSEVERYRRLYLPRGSRFSRQYVAQDPLPQAQPWQQAAAAALRTLRERGTDPSAATAGGAQPEPGPAQPDDQVSPLCVSPWLRPVFLALTSCAVSYDPPSCVPCLHS